MPFFQLPHQLFATLARIAGHSSITITQRYCHPQADAVEAAFSKFGSIAQPDKGSKKLNDESEEMQEGLRLLTGAHQDE